MKWVIQKTTTYIDGKQVTDFFKCLSFRFEEYTGDISQAKRFKAMKEAQAFVMASLKERLCDEIKYVKVGEQP